MAENVLIVEDDALQREMLATLLHRKLDLKALKAENGREALDLLNNDKNRQIRLVIMDLDMPVMDGMEALPIIKSQYPDIAVVMLTGSKDIDNAVEALKIGAADFVTKPYEGERMAATIKNALKISVLSQEVTRLKTEKDGHSGFENVIGYNAGLQKTIESARKAARADIPVLVTGETGTGKEVLSRAIHGESGRAGQNFIAVNCGAIPSQLVESTLFGHEKGAFTGATEKVPGKFREAQSGTIFLDEVGELPLETQVKLLRVLQQKEVEPVGAATPVQADVRVISATNRNLQEEVDKGRFREDLYYRLNVVEINMPALGDRREDIPALISHFLLRQQAESNGSLKSLSDEAIEYLASRDWPGNVRELENAIRRAAIMSDNTMLTKDDFAMALSSSVQENSTTANDTMNPVDLKTDNGKLKTAAEVEKDLIKEAIKKYDGNITQAAKAIGMAKSTFYKKMKLLDA